MSTLVNDLLTLARCDGAMALPRETIDLNEVVRDEVDMQTVLAEEKNLRLRVMQGENCLVEIDRSQFRQAVSNILHNAIKYSPQGFDIHIQVGKNKELCFVEIRDQGPGIGAEHRERIFDRFYRVDKVRSRETGGAG
ncbi:MAG: HAMP protein, partial [uncultured bacterium]